MKNSGALFRSCYYVDLWAVATRSSCFFFKLTIAFLLFGHCVCISFFVYSILIGFFGSILGDLGDLDGLKLGSLEDHFLSS